MDTGTINTIIKLGLLGINKEVGDFTLTSDGEEFFLDPKPVPALNYFAHDADSFVDLMCSNEFVCGKNRHVLVNSTEVVGFSTLEGRRARVCLKLRQHPAAAQLERWESGHRTSQAGLLRVLRTHFANMVDASVVQILSVLEFNQTRNGVSAVNNGSVAISSAIKQQVRGNNGTLPTEIIFNVPMFNIAGERDRCYPVVALLECVPGENNSAMFELFTVGNDLANAREAALFDLQTDLMGKLHEAGEAGAGVNVYLGGVE
jgi:hypothetical protein